MTDEHEIVLVDEDGEEHRFILYQVLEVEDTNYALLEPSIAEGELVVLRFEGPVEEGQLVALDDDEWERIAEILGSEGYEVQEGD